MGMKEQFSVNSVLWSLQSLPFRTGNAAPILGFIDIWHLFLIGEPQSKNLERSN